jgi:SNF family Na+-dependent transporter
MFSFLFGVIFFGAVTVAILTGLVVLVLVLVLVLVCEEVASPRRNASRLHKMLGPQLDA